MIQIEKQIEWEEQGAKHVPVAIQSIPHIDDKDEWDDYWQAQELEREELKASTIKKHATNAETC